MYQLKPFSKRACMLLVCVICTCQLAACKQPQAQTKPTAVSTAVTSYYEPSPAVGDFTQSPWLDNQAELPPINERLPSIPVVVNMPDMEVGTYTGEEIVIDDGPFDNPEYDGVVHRVTEWYCKR